MSDYPKGSRVRFTRATLRANRHRAYTVDEVTLTGVTVSCEGTGTDRHVYRMSREAFCDLGPVVLAGSKPEGGQS